MRRLNTKLFVGLIVSILALSVGVHLLHGFQSSRNTKALLREARRAEEAGRRDDVVRYLQRYLAFQPHDTDALASLGLALDELATNSGSRLRVFETLEEVLRNDPDRDDVRRRLAEVAIDIGRFDDALLHLARLRETAPDDGALDYLVGKCHEANGQYEDAARSFADAVRHKPEQIDAYTRLAHVLHARLDQSDAAAEVMDKLVAANGDSAQAYLARAHHRRQAGELELAGNDVTRALELAADDAETLIAAAYLNLDRAQTAGVGDREAATTHLAEARRHLERGRDLHPEDARFHQSLATVELRSGRTDAAIACVRRGLEAAPGNADLLWRLGDLLIDANKPAEAAGIIEELRAAGIPRALVEYLDARLLAKQERWSDAAKLFERVRPLLVLSEQLTTEADLALSECHQRLGDSERQLAAARRAATASPLLVSARFAVASSLLGLGRIHEAVSEYRHMIKLADAPAIAKVELARLLIVRNLLAAPAQRNWIEVADVLDQAGERLPDCVDVPLLRAEALAAQEKAGESQSVLDAAGERWPDHVRIWIARAALADRRGDTPGALNLLAQASRRTGDCAELRLAMARLCVKQGGDGVNKRLAELCAGDESFGLDDRVSLLRGLADAHYHAGDLAEAQRLWARVAELQPNNLAIRLHLFDQALEAGNATALNQTLAEIRRIEGEGGALARYGEACRMIKQARDGDKQLLAGARTLLAAAAMRRPAWSRVPVREAEIDELEGNPSRAIDSYLRAIELGERSHDVLRRVVQLLYERRRYVEADQAIRKLQTQPLSPLSGELQRMAADVSLQVQDHARALDLARQAVAAQPNEYGNHVWLGQVLWATGQRNEAEQPLRRAVELAEHEAGAWASLVLYLSRVGRVEEAEQALAQLPQKLPSGQAPLVLAQCYEAVGRIDRAAQQYQAALAACPDDVAVLRAFASFWLRSGQLAQAEPALRRMITNANAASAEAAWARRGLAVLLGTRGHRQAQEAIKLIDQNIACHGKNSDDLRAMAVICAAQKNGAARRRAVDLFQELSDRQSLAPDDQFLLVRLFEDQGNWPKAREHMQLLLAAEGHNPLYLAHCARMLLSRGEPDQAQLWLDRLEEMEPTSFRTVEIKARVLAADGEHEKALKLLRGFVQALLGNDQPDPTVIRLAAAAFEDLGQRLDRMDSRGLSGAFMSEAESLQRRLASLAPSGALSLAAFLGRRGDVAGALTSCEQAAAGCPAEAVVFTGVEIVRAARAGDSDCRRVEQWIETAIQANPTSAASRLALAALRDHQGRFEETESLYRDVIRLDPVDTTALNNLAWLLARQGGRAGAEGKRLIDEAIRIAGPLPELLDTRAAVHLALGDTAAALADLNEALAGQSPGGEEAATLSFHIARVQHVAKNQHAARTALNRARVAGLETNDLHPLERGDFAELTAALGGAN
jgi:tetratricopeptide (TPR) repeat protein